MSRQKNLKRNLLICLLAGSAVMYTLPLHAATSVVANNALPTLPMVNGQIKDGYGFVTGGNNTNIVTDGLQMNITQNDSNAAIKWGSFDVGGSATVNFDYTGKSDFNTLNYVNSASASQIYGTINAQHEGYNGNIFVVNPAGVQIGPSAQINVGSLYVSNKYLNENELAKFNGNNITSLLIDTTKTANAELMSLGNINAANNVTFDGNRIVLDTDRVIIADSQNGKLNIKTTDTNNVVLGYEAYDENNGYTDTVNKEKSFDVTKVTIKNGTIEEQDTNVKGYMWVEDVEQLQAINTNLGGNYALRNSIDATSTEQNGFNPIGLSATGQLINNGFSGKFDGIDYNIFGLTINDSQLTHVGLFAGANHAVINNVTLVGGSITGGTEVGAIVGAAINGTVINNVINSAAVNGNGEVGGIVGVADDTTITNAVNTGTIDGKNNNVGGLIGLLENGSTLNGNSYNLGDVSSEGHNVGGLVGHAVNSTIGNPSVVNGKPVENVQVVYNRLDVEGAYNVGGIVGNMKGTTVQNAENSGNVTATGYKDDVYKYHAGTKDNTDLKTVDVYVANVGSIAGSSSQDSAISDVENTGDVKTGTEQTNIYAAGNVGGIVGSAVDTNITNATNKENEIRGAHNVGGVAGYFGNISDDKIAPDYTLTTGINDGGDIMATGARYNGGFVTELVRANGSGNENFTIGNIGGVVGYLDGDNVYVTGGANRGTVHTYDEFTGTTVPNYAKAANVGGVVGKLDRSDTLTIAEMKENGQIDVTNAAVSNSYNTGDVLGYTGVGGVVGMMYNGEVAGSYNLGYIRTTRQSDTSSEENTDIIDSLNMGGIVGDTTEETQAEVLLYDVYNKGQIGDNDFNYFGRHVGGVVGRLSGEVQKAYNTGAIYNGYNVVGGIAGWMYKGKIENAFNTGNITVYNKNKASSQVGGVVGAAANATNITINNVYNLGTIRSFKANSADSATNSLGGILGEYNTNYSSNTKITISNAYTTGNLYVNSGNIGSIYGVVDDRYITLRNTYYIRPQDGLGFDDLWNNRDNANHAVEFTEKSTYDYQFDNGIIKPKTEETGEINENADWRIYDGNTPILNAFLPNAEKYFDQYQNKQDLNDAGINSIQYGTAYDPLLTIIKANGTKDNLSYNWSDLGISSAAGIAVYGAGLTLDDINTSDGTGYFGGTIYADGALNLNAKVKDTNNISGNIGLGSASQIYGSSVNIDADGKVTIYGDVTATGNRDNGTNDTIDTSLAVKDAGNITITGSDVDVYGTLTSATKDTTGATVKIPGIEGNAVTWEPGAINNPAAAMDDIADRFAHTTGQSAVDGDITITANGVKDENDEIIGGNVNLYYGNKQEGLITAGGNLDVTGTGNVYVDSDLDIGGNLTLTGNGENSEVVLDLTNIGQVQAKNGTANSALDGFHDFMHHFGSQTGDDDRQITLNAKISGDAKLTIDMWDETQNNGQGGYNLEKYDQNTGHDLVSELNNLNIKANIKTNNGTIGDVTSARPITYIWVSDGDQLQAINNNGVNGLSYNYALKNDINASDVENYVAIGTGSEFTGTFDGRGNRIIGLDTTKRSTGNGNTLTNAGIFSTVGTTGVVKNVNIYSGNFKGTNTAGAVAGVNKGRIENVTGFGNTVEVSSAGIAGGIVGKNEGKGNFVTADGASTLTGNGIYDVQSIGSVITASGVAGGLVGTNEGALGNSYSDSAVTSTDGTSKGLGGVVGVNTGDVQFVDSLGVTNGGTNSDKVGGIIGVNNGNMYSGYNESIVSGKNNVGGIIGQNDGGKNYTVDADGTIIWNKGTVENVVNATGVTGSSNYVGGLVGTNTGSVTNGRNNGTITGTNYVGGLVGDNADEHSILTNLVNDSSAEILGEEYVGGIAGTNAGTITAQNQANLINRGSITGQNYVGGVAGENIGTIEYVNNDVSLNVKDTTEKASYFGGVAGINGRVDDDPDDGVDNNKKGTITNATNEGNVIAPNADYVGGIVGHNTVNGVLDGMGNSNDGRVEGATYVGGVAGKNDAAITGAVNDMVGIENNGVVIAHKGGAGGIFGENTGDIKYAELTNNGIVSGTYSNNDVAGTGGIFGVNSGDITYSSLKNNIGGQVIGTQNVGGLIGINTGTITGGRIEADGTDADYYKYQIYNNGVINVGTWTDNADSTAEGYGKVDANEFKAAAGSNIGGLIGSNTGSLTAGYNTGAINAGSSSNVGGIVGNNAGTVDQVFNTVMVSPDDKNKGQAEAITGGTNVGGLVGTNSGTLSNAYNTTEVKSTNNGVVGNAVGENDTNGTIENIYASNTSGKLIGSNINTAQDAIQNAYSFVKDDTSATTVLDEKVAQKAEESYEFDNKDDGTTWKFYDGYSNPLLKVFLTTLTVDSDQVDLVYNAGEQDLNIGQLVQDGIISAPVVKDNIIYDGMDAYHNTVIKDEDNKLGASELLQNTTGQKDAGTYDNWLYSGQIASGSKDGSGFNPNNLGYDIVYTKNDSGETGVEIGKATINIDLGKVEHTYGNADVINGTGDFKNEAGYGFEFNITNSNLTQEMKDELNDKGLGFVFEKDNALTGDTSGRVTEDVKDGGYTWSANFELSEELKKNYQFDDNGSATLNKADGQSIVNQAKLEISVDDAETMPGVVPNFTGTNIQQGLVNGDVAGNYDYALDSSVDINVDDIYTDKIGISFGNSETYYDLDNVDWSTIPGWEFLKNYDINFDPGTLTVDSEIMPDLPDNWPNNRWDYLFGDNPFDRNENFRERKAEVNFVDGAMEI